MQQSYDLIPAGQQSEKDLVIQLFNKIGESKLDLIAIQDLVQQISPDTLSHEKKDGFTLLGFSVHKHKENSDLRKLLKLLVVAGANIEVETNSNIGCYLYWFWCYSKDKVAFQKMLKKEDKELSDEMGKVDINTKIFLSISEDDLEKYKEAVGKASTSKNLPVNDIKDNFGNTVFHYVIAYKSIKIRDYLFKNEALVIDVPNKKGITPLMLCVGFLENSGSDSFLVETAGKLISYGADPLKLGNEGFSPFLMAILKFGRGMGMLEEIIKRNSTILNQKMLIGSFNVLPVHIPQMTMNRLRLECDEDQSYYDEPLDNIAVMLQISIEKRLSQNKHTSKKEIEKQMKILIGMLSPKTKWQKYEEILIEYLHNKTSVSGFPALATGLAGAIYIYFNRIREIVIPPNGVAHPYLIMTATWMSNNKIIASLGFSLLSTLAVYGGYKLYTNLNSIEPIPEEYRVSNSCDSEIQDEIEKKTHSSAASSRAKPGFISQLTMLPVLFLAKMAGQVSSSMAQLKMRNLFSYYTSPLESKSCDPSTFLDYAVNFSKIAMQFPGQSALMLLQIPAVKLGQYRDRKGPLTDAVTQKLKHYQQKLIEWRQQLKPHLEALAKADPQFASDSQYLLKTLQSELTPAIRSGQGSGLLLERVERLMGYLGKRVKAILAWASSESSSEEILCSESAEKESDKFFAEQLSHRPESFMSQLMGSIGLWNASRPISTVMDSKPMEQLNVSLLYK